MHTLKKPDGQEVQVNNQSLAHALSLGWKEVKKKAPPKKTRKPKAE